MAMLPEIGTGVQGVIGPTITGMVEGIELPIYLIGFIFFIYSLQQVRKEEWNPYSLIGPIGVVSLVSWIATGNASTMILLFGIGAGAYFLRDHLPMQPAGEEKLTREERETLEESIEGMAGRIEALEKGIKSEEAKLPPEDKKALQAEERIARAEEFQLAQAAAIDEIGIAVIQQAQMERQALQLELQELPKLGQVVGSVEQQISSLQSFEEIKTQATRLLPGAIQASVSTTGKIAQTELNLARNRQRFISKLAKDINEITDLTEKTNSITKSVGKIENKISGKIGQNTIKKVNSTLRIKIGALRTLSRESRGKEAVYQQQIAALQTEIRQIREMMQQLKSMQTGLSGAVKATQQTTNEIKTTTQQMLQQEKTLGNQLKTITSSLEPIKKADKQLEAAIEELRAVLNVIKTAEQEIVAEETIIKTTQAIGKVFTAVEKLQTITMEMHAKGTIPLINTLIQLIPISQVLDKSLNKLLGQVENIAIGIYQLVNAAERLVNKAGTQDKKLFELLQAEHTTLTQASQTKMQILRKAAAQLNQAQQAITQQITTTNQLIQREKQTEQQINAELTKLLNIIVRRKTEISKQFQQQAQQFQLQMAAAQRGQAPARPAQPRAA